MSPTSLAVLNRFQRDFPLVSRPFAAMARALATTEDAVLDTLADGLAQGTVARIGPVFAPNAVGASTLAALTVPPHRLEAVAAGVSAHPAVTHNYARDHAWNLWFVATAADDAALSHALATIERDAGCGPLLDLRLEAEYHIDLGFDLEHGGRRWPGVASRTSPGSIALDHATRALVDALAAGLPLVPQPFTAIADAIGSTESAVLDTIARWTASGVIRRFGVVVRHAELGYRANAMAVWQVPEADVAARGAALAAMPGITLCYRRRTVPHLWPYNLFCMVHGEARETVDATLRHAAHACGLDAHPGVVLATLARFKQRGLSRWQPREAAHA